MKEFERLYSMEFYEAFFEPNEPMDLHSVIEIDQELV